MFALRAAGGIVAGVWVAGMSAYSSAIWVDIWMTHKLRQHTKNPVVVLHPFRNMSTDTFDAIRHDLERMADRTEPLTSPVPFRATVVQASDGDGYAIDVEPIGSDCPHVSSLSFRSGIFYTTVKKPMNDLPAFYRTSTFDLGHYTVAVNVK